MADAPKILGTDTLRQAYPKLNNAIDNANEAIVKALLSETNSTLSKAIAEAVRYEFDQIIADSGSSNIEIVNSRGTFPLLKNRLDGIDSKTGNLSTLPVGFQDSLVFAINKLYESMTEINVRQPPYNLKGDGTDEHATLQTLFDLANSNGSVYLYFPKGDYGMTGYLRLYSNTFVRMHNEASIKRLGTGYKVFINGELGNDTYATSYDGEGNIHFTGGAIDLNTIDSPLTAVDKSTSAFDLGHGENISFNNLTVKNGQGGHYFQVSSCKNVLFSGCTFKDQHHTNVSYVLSEVIQIEVASDASFPTFGGYDNTISRDIIIENCTFKNVIRALGTHSDGLYGGAEVLYSENVKIMNNIFDTSIDHMINLTAFKDTVVKNNLIVNSSGYGMYLSKVIESKIEGNTLFSIQKAGIYLSNSHDNKFSKNNVREVAIIADPPYSAYRLTMSNNNIFDNETVYSDVPNYHSAFYASDGCVGNKILSHNFKKGVTNLIGGSDSTEIRNIQIGPEQTVLFAGDLGIINDTAIFTLDIRNYSQLIICGNDNSSDTAGITTMVLPRALIIFGSTVGRFRFVPDDTDSDVGGGVNRVDFSFPDTVTLRIDDVKGTSHIRKIIGIS